MPGIVEDRVHEGYAGPPQTCGLVWSPGRIVCTRRGERRLTTATATPAFTEAWEAACVELDEIGFSWDSAERVAFWERRDLDHGRMAAVIDSLPARVVEAKAEADRRTREARERAERGETLRRERERAFIEKARQIGRESLHARRWAWAKGSLIDEAQELIDDPMLSSTSAKRLLELVRQADKNVQRGQSRILIAHEPEMDRAAVIDITAADQDWALLRNEIGWFRSTTVDGHILAGLDAWTQEQASHALKLLRVHRKQVAPHLHQVLFPAPALPLSLSQAA